MEFQRPQPSPDNLGYDPSHQESVGWRPGEALFQEHFSRYQFASTSAAGHAVLDCACGKGYGAYTMARHASSVIGVDMNKESIAIAAASFAAPNLRFKVADATKLGVLNEAFDTITAFEIIEHLPPDMADDFVEGLASVLRPGGRLLLSTPNHDVVTKSGSLVPSYHINNYRPVQLRQLLRRHFRSVTLLGQFRRRQHLNKVLFDLDIVNARHLLGYPLRRLRAARDGDDTGRGVGVGPDYFQDAASLLDQYVFSERHWRQAGLTLAICAEPIG